MAKRFDDDNATEALGSDGAKGAHRTYFFLPTMEDGKVYTLRAVPLEYDEHGIDGGKTFSVLTRYENEDSKGTKFPNAAKHKRATSSCYLEKARAYYAKAKDRDDRLDPMNVKGGEFWPGARYYMNVILTHINGKPQEIWWTQEEFDEMVDCPAKDFLGDHGVKFKSGMKYPKIFVFAFGNQIQKELKTLINGDNAEEGHGAYHRAGKGGWSFKVKRIGTSKTTEYKTTFGANGPFIADKENPTLCDKKRLEQFSEASWPLETLLFGEDAFVSEKEEKALMNGAVTYYELKRGEWDGSTKPKDIDEDEDEEEKPRKKSKKKVDDDEDDDEDDASPPKSKAKKKLKSSDGEFEAEEVDDDDDEDDDEDDAPPPKSKAKAKSKSKAKPVDDDDEDEDDEDEDEDDAPPPKKKGKAKPVDDDEDEDDDDEDDAPPPKKKSKAKPVDDDEDDDDDDDDDITTKLRNRKKK